MKTALIGCFLLVPFAQALEIHEWGTFTVLSGSNGMTVPWYSRTEEIAHLPAFVRPGFIGKGRLVAKVRMETPVIYFYPEKETKVTVDVSFAQGTITETFPHSMVKASVSPTTNGMAFDGKWSGFLRPPTDKKALDLIPEIPHSDTAEPYGAAREVPDAWIFESDLKETAGQATPPKRPEAEKFIFYRGAGDASIPISARMDGGNATVANYAPESVDFGVALRVRDGKAAWVVIPPLSPPPLDSGTPAMNESKITFPTPDRLLDEVESELAEAWKEALAADGLTPAEASAMVETWRKTWFRESGDRILTLVPRKTIDALLPLKITPAPSKMERVFVARMEMVSPEREQALVALLNSTSETGEAEVSEFDKLSLGRFANGAVEIAVDIQSRNMRSKFFGFRQFGANRGTSSR